MFKSLLLFSIPFWIFSFCLHAEQLMLSSKGNMARDEVLFLRNAHTLCFLDNGLILNLCNPPFENQSWTEWCFGDEHLQPDPLFYFQLRMWNKSVNVQLYHYTWESDPTVRHPLEAMRNLVSDYPYCVENGETGEKTLCQVWDINDLEQFLVLYGNECFEKGRASGFGAGLTIGRQSK